MIVSAVTLQQKKTAHNTPTNGPRSMIEKQLSVKMEMDTPSLSQICL